MCPFRGLAAMWLRDKRLLNYLRYLWSLVKNVLLGLFLRIHVIWDLLDYPCCTIGLSNFFAS